MNLNFDCTRRTFALTAAAAGFTGMARAETYPSRLVTILLPTSPGSGVDATVRRLVPALSKGLGQQVIIDYKAGAGGLLGITQLVKSAPDGYTCGLVTASYCAIPSLYTIPYDPLRDLQPVSILSAGPLVLVVNAANVKATNLQQLVELAHKRASGRALSFGNAGNGSTVQIAAAQLAIAAKLDVSHVPYKAAGQYTTDLVGGVLDAGFLPPILALPFIKEGRLRPIGMSTGTRVAVLPNVPTLQELGLPGFNVDGWIAVVVPAKVPKPIVERLHHEFVRAVRDPEFVSYAAENGGYVVASSIQDAEKTFARDLNDAARIIKQMGIKPE